MIDNFKQLIFEFLTTSDINPKFIETIGHMLLLLSALTVSYFVGYICRKFVAPLVLNLVKNTKNIWDDYFLNKPVVKALCHIVPGIVFYLFLPFCLPERQVLIHVIITQAVKIYIAITFVSLATAFLNNIEYFTINDEKFKDKQLYGIIEFLKIVAYFIGGIVIISFLIGQNPLSMIAGIGAAATVLMLVFKDSILGLVAGIQLSVNKMLKPGDWITIKKMNINGVVEHVSLTTVKIRNFDNTISTVPPYFLISDSFQNWSPMKNSSGRRVKRAIFIDTNSIGYCDEILLKQLRSQSFINEDENQAALGKVNLTLFRAYVEKYLRTLPHVNTDDLVFARQLDPTPNGLPLEIYYYSKVTLFTEYESLAAETIENIIAALPNFGLRLFQSPTGNDLRFLKSEDSITN